MIGRNKVPEENIFSLNQGKYDSMALQLDYLKEELSEIQNELNFSKEILNNAGMTYSFFMIRDSEQTMLSLERIIRKLIPEYG